MPWDIDWTDHATGTQWPVVKAKNFTAVARPPAGVRLIVIHITVNPCVDGMAMGVAKMFAGVKAPQASSHVVVDPSQVIRCVEPAAVAWCAPGANADGFHIEHTANMGDDWGDEPHARCLRLSAAIAARVAKACGIEIRKLSVAEIKGRVAKGFCGHVDVNSAFHLSDHVDPGPTFPWNDYLDLVKLEMGDA